MPRGRSRAMPSKRSSGSRRRRCRTRARRRRSRAEGNYTALEDLLGEFERKWENQGFLTWEHQEARKAAGREALMRFWNEEEADGVKPSHIEKEFGFAIGADRVRGRFDR